MKSDTPDALEPQPSVAASPTLLPSPTMPGKYGGQLRRGNPGNRGNKNGRRSAIAREILEASTPQAARILKHMSLKGEIPPRKKGEKAQPLSHPDHIKALVAHLDRGAVPARNELSAADGVIVVAVRGREDEVIEQAAPPLRLASGGPAS
jgi:hypothetical protein